MEVYVCSGLEQQLAAKTDATAFTKHLVEALLTSCQRLVDELREQSPELLSSLQQVNLLKRMTAILEAIEKNTEAILRGAQVDAHAARSEWIQIYRGLCKEVHGYITPPDFETNRKIPMGDLYVAPRLQKSDLSFPFSIGPVMGLRDLQRAIDRTVVLGDPGGGKSTLSAYLAMSWASSTTELVPFHVVLRDFAKQPEGLSVLQFIEATLAPIYQLDALPGLVEDLLLTGEAVVIFDGLDELIDTSKRRAVTQAVETFGIRYPLAKILVTSRRVGYSQARLDPTVYSAFNIDGFVESDVNEYVGKWFASQSDYTATEAVVRAHGFMQQSEAVPDLRSNPLMLALMCIIFRGENFIPRNRPAVYEKCAVLLFEKWDGHRDIEVALQARAHVDAAMKYVAHWVLISDTADSGVARDDLVRIMTKYLYPRAMETEETARRAAEEFVDFCTGRAWVFADAGTTSSGDVLYTFTHRTFMEYFAAFHLTRINDTPEKLAQDLLPHVAREEWDVVAQLAIQITNNYADQGSERALGVMLNDTRRRTSANREHILAFIARCARFAIVSPAFIRSLTRNIIAFYTHTDTTDEAVLSSLTGAWTILADAVADEHVATVASAAEEQLLADIQHHDGRISLRAKYLILHGVAEGFTDIIFDPVGQGVWMDMFTRLASSQRQGLLALSSDGPLVHGILLLSRTIDVADAIAAMKEAGLGFGDIWFEGYKGAPSLATSFLRSVTYNFDISERHNESVIQELVAAFMADWGSGAPLEWFHCTAETYQFFQVYDAPRVWSVESPLSQMTKDVVFLASVAPVETIVAGGVRRRINAVTDDGLRRSYLETFQMLTAPVEDTIADMDLSPDVKGFIGSWLANDASIFHSITFSDPV